MSAIASQQILSADPLTSSSQPLTSVSATRLASLAVQAGVSTRSVLRCLVSCVWRSLWLRLPRDGGAKGGSMILALISI
eukprot:3145080-Pleurochrysis_carterae.AAC.5